MFNPDLPRFMRFNEVAALYDRARPQCPDVALDCAVDRLGIAHSAHILEVGCATGQATRGLLQRVARVTAVDAGDNLIAFAREAFQGEDRVSWVCARFEEFAEGVASPAFDALFGVQCMHWMEPTEALQHILNTVYPRGGVGLIWHRDRSQNTAFWSDTNPLYDRWMPPRSAQKTVAYGAVAYRRALEEDARFDAVCVDRFSWSHIYTKSAYMDLIGTFSDHRALPDRAREKLFQGIASVVDAHGGSVERLYETVVLTARVR